MIGKDPYGICVLLKELFDYYKIEVTDKSIREFVITHPAYPSLSTITDALNEWNVENMSLMLETDQLEKLTEPFVTHMNMNGGMFIIVKKIEQGKIQCWMPDKGIHSMDMSTFLHHWSHIVLIFNPSARAGEKDYHFKRKVETLQKMRLPFIAGAAALILVLSIWLAFRDNGLYDGFVLSVLAISNVFGIILSLGLYMTEHNASPKLIKKWCYANKNTDCNKVLKSPAGKLFGFISWAEVGILFFTGNLLFLIIADMAPLIFHLMAFIILLAIPYTFFSVVYQSFVVRKWCTLCLIIQAIVWIQAAFLLPYFSFQPIIDWGLILRDFTLSYTISAMVLMFMGPYFQLDTVKIALMKTLNAFKRNPDIFNLLLSAGKRIEVEKNTGLIFGNQNGMTMLTMVSNPYCQPCGEASKVLNDMLEINEDLCLQLFFLPNNMDRENNTNEMLVHLISMYREKGPGLTKEALAWWYNMEDKDLTIWKQQFPCNHILEKGENILAEHQEFCERADVRYTPTFYLNGYILPEVFTYADLRTVISYLRQ